jgi:iron complex outermembrane receptor protein
LYAPALLFGSAAVAIAPNARAQLEEVIVTAQKREQSQQDIAMSINAVSGETLDSRRIETPMDMQALSPNVNVKEISPGLFPVFTIRGVGLNDFSANNNPTVGVYLDEVFLTSTTQLTFQLYDIERVEVLKGPQGTLYGRNTTGGAISFVTRQAAFEDDWQLSLGGGAYDLLETEFMGNKALSDRLAVRVSGKYVNQGEGFYESRTLGGRDIGRREEFATRVNSTWLATDSLDVSLKLEASRSRSEVGQFEHFGTFQPGSFPPVPCAPILAGRIDPTTCADGLGYRDTDGDPFTGDWNNAARFDSDGRAITARLNWELGAGTLSSVSGWRSFERKAFNDTDAGPFVQAEFDVLDEVEQFSQELRYTVSPGADLDLILGGFYSYDEVSIDVPGRLDDLFFTRVAIASQQETRSVAAFAQADWRFASDWSLTAGLRLTDEEKEFSGGMQDTNPFCTSCLLSPVCAPGFVGAVPIASNDETISVTEPSARLALSYFAGEETHFYASVARGFKSGGFFGGGFVTSDEQLESFDQEILVAWEAGFKTRLLENTLQINGAAFYYDYSDVQTFTQVDAGALSVLKLSNVDEAEIVGAEADILWRPAGGLSLQANIGYLDTELGAFDAPGGGRIPAGNALPNAPEWSYNLFARYEWQPTELGVVTTQLEYAFTDDTFREAVNIPFLATESYGLWGARIALRSPSDRWEASLWGRNITDEHYTLHGFDNGIGNGGRTYGAPRTWGLSLRINAL